MWYLLRSGPEHVIKSCVPFVIDYRAFVHVYKRKANIDTLDQIQNRAMRTALGHRNSIPANVILAESKLQLTHRRENKISTGVISF